MSDNNAVSVYDATPAGGSLAGLTDTTGFYTSLAQNTQAEKLAVLKAVNNSVPMADHLNTPIKVVNFIAQAVQVQSSEDPEKVNDAVRVTIIDEDGNAFHATSNGIFLSLKNVFKILGEPQHWDEPLEVTVVKEGTGNRKFLTLKY